MTGDCAAYPFGEADCVVDREAWYQCGELFAAQATDGAFGPDAVAQAGGDFADHSVTNRVTEIIVQMFEVVDIQDDK